MLTKALSDVRSDLEYQADIKLNSAGRHTPDQVDRLINDSFRSLQDKLSAIGSVFYLVEGAQATLPTSRADTNEVYSVIDWPVAARTISRVDVFVDGCWSSLERVEWIHIRKYARGVDSPAFRPIVFAVKSSGEVATTTASAGEIAIAPFSSNGSYKLSYLPEWTNLTTDSHLFRFPNEAAFQWLIWDCTVKIAARDRDSKKRHAIAVSERAKCEEELSSLSPAMVDTGSQTVTRSRRYRD